MNVLIIVCFWKYGENVIGAVSHMSRAAQGFGAAVGDIVCPQSIIAGVATVGSSGQEGAILSRTVLACTASALAGGILVSVLNPRRWAEPGVSPCR